MERTRRLKRGETKPLYYSTALSEPSSKQYLVSSRQFKVAANLLQRHIVNKQNYNCSRDENSFPKKTPSTTLWEYPTMDSAPLILERTLAVDTLFYTEVNRGALNCILKLPARHRRNHNGSLPVSRLLTYSGKEIRIRIRSLNLCHLPH